MSDTTTGGSKLRKASRLDSISISPILAITARAAALQKEGKDIISLGIGEPDFDTPDAVKAAACEAIKTGDTKYTALDGSPAMKAAIRDKFERENNLSFELSQITVSTGAKQVIYNAMMATLEEGDEVILPAPFWVSYADIVGIAGGKPVVVPTHEANGFCLTAESLEGAITPRTRWLFINSPSNPSGATYDAQAYETILAVLRRHPDIWLLVDDIYEHIVFDGFKFVTAAELAPDLRDRILTINGVSKAYAMTGWRVGFAGGPRDLVAAMAAVQSQSTSCPSSVSQRAAIAALGGSQAIVRERCKEYELRRNKVVAGLNAIPGLSCSSPRGSFYAFPNCSRLLGKKTPSGELVRNDIDLARYLLEKASVAVVPGSAFGVEGFFRVSYATSLQLINDACHRMRVACSELK